MITPRVSIVIPYHNIPETAFFLGRLINSIEQQTFKDYEIVLEKYGRMAETYNVAIQKSRGEMVKLMGMDDYFFDPDALENIVKAFDLSPDSWWITASRNQDVPKIDEGLDWVVDCDWYWRIYQQHGLPKVLTDMNVVIGIGPHQSTNILSDEQKLKEHGLMRERYGN